MPIESASPGDATNTLLHKILQNEAQVIDQTSSYSIAAGVATATPRYAYVGDSNNTLLRKILDNQERVISGSLVYNLT